MTKAHPTGQHFNIEHAIFANPIDASGADPWVFMWRHKYYYCRVSKGNIILSHADQLPDIAKHKTTVWHARAHTQYCKQVWAPELHHIKDRWYIYFAANNGRNENHRMYVLESEGRSPEGAYHFKSQLQLQPDRWAVDGTVLQLSKSEQYFIWSGWEGKENVQQNLYIAKLKNPWTPTGDRVCISEPTYAWETCSSPRINEAPEVLRHEGKVFIVYSPRGAGQTTIVWGSSNILAATLC